MTDQPTTGDESRKRRSPGAKLLEWTRRYGVAECLGIVAAIAAATAALTVAGSGPYLEAQAAALLILRIATCARIWAALARGKNNWNR